MALTPDELRKCIPKWSLESDGQLLQYMVQISKNLEEKCKQTQDNLTSLLLEVDESHIRFANASNSFNGIQQLKFVENRVQDDDESFYSVREEKEEKEEKLPYGEIFHMSVEKSVANMYKTFEKITVELDSDSDSDDDDEEATARNTVLRAVQKYPYLNRPLPYIIGSKEWREKWHAGLIDSDEESDMEPKEQYSDSSDSERISPSQTNSNHTPSESEGSVWGVHPDPLRRAPSIDRSVSGDDALSIQSSSSAARTQGVRSLLNNPHRVPMLAGFKPPSLFPDQPPSDDTISVSSRSKVPNLFEESDEDESTPTHRPTNMNENTNTQPSYFRGNQPERKTINLFTNEPPPSHGIPESAHSSSISSNSQKKPVNLFIDSDDDDSFNNNLSSKSSSIYQNEPPELLPVTVKKQTNLFDDDEEEVTPRANPMISGKPTGNIFDKLNNNRNEEEEVEDDLFVPVQRSINGAFADGTGVRRVTNLFDDDPPEDDFDKIFKTEIPKIPGGKVTLQPAAISERHGATNTLGKKFATNPHQPETESAQRVAEQNPKKQINLFDDDEDVSGDIFSVRVMDKKSSVTKPKINLFDDDYDDHSSGLGSKLPQISSGAGNDTNHDPPIYETVKPLKVIDNHGDGIQSDIIKKKSIFDSDSNDDDEDNDFLFGGKRPVPTSVENINPKPLPRKQKVDLRTFAPDLEKQLSEEKPNTSADIPESIGPQVTSKSDQTQADIRSEIIKKKNMFGTESDETDEDVLFKEEKSPIIVAVKNKVQILDPDAQSPTNFDNSSKENETSRLVGLPEIPRVGVGLEKPQIPDEPPEDDGWEKPSPDNHEQKYPDVSNDIDYYLTTNRITETSSTLLAQTKPVNLIENSLTNVDVSVGNADEPSENATVHHYNDGSHNSSKVEINDVGMNSSDVSPGLKDNTANKKSALNFNSIGLFDDIPPPDDDFEEPRPSLASDHIDEDGLFGVRAPETLNSTAGSSSTNHYLFMDGDGPPPDDEVDDGKTIPKVHESAPFKSISSIIEERNKEESSSEIIREKPKINKLSATVNINVNALLPGARRPYSTVAEQTVSVSAASNVAIRDISHIKGSMNTTEQKYKQEPDIGSEKLTSLNKGRAKIQTKRKPPSRQNRRSNYKNNLESETNEDFNDPSTDKRPEDEIRVVVGSERYIQHVEATIAHVKIDQMLSSELAQKPSEPQFIEGSSGGTKSSINATVPKNSILSVAEPSSKPLTLDQPAPPKLKTSTKLFSDEESDDDDLFGKNAKSFQKPSTNQTAAITMPIKQQEVHLSKSATTSSIIKQSIFDDSDEGDDIFSKPRTNGKSSASNQQFGQSNINTIPTNKSKSIFESDEESDGGDIFRGSKNISKPSLKVSEGKRSVVATNSKSLFGEDDDEDEDDLFGSKSKPTPKSAFSTIPAAKNTVKNTTKLNPLAAVAEDDPLADLLK